MKVRRRHKRRIEVTFVDPNGIKRCKMMTKTKLLKYLDPRMHNSIDEIFKMKGITIRTQRNLA